MFGDIFLAFGTTGIKKSTRFSLCWLLDQVRDVPADCFFLSDKTTNNFFEKDAVWTKKLLLPTTKNIYGGFPMVDKSTRYHSCSHRGFSAVCPLSIAFFLANCSKSFISSVTQPIGKIHNDIYIFWSKLLKQAEKLFDRIYLKIIKKEQGTRTTWWSKGKRKKNTQQRKKKKKKEDKFGAQVTRRRQGGRHNATFSLQHKHSNSSGQNIGNLSNLLTRLIRVIQLYDATLIIPSPYWIFWARAINVWYQKKTQSPLDYR